MPPSLPPQWGAYRYVQNENDLSERREALRHCAERIIYSAALTQNRVLDWDTYQEFATNHTDPLGKQSVACKAAALRIEGVDE